MVTKSWCILSHVRKKVISANGDEIIVFPMLHRNDRERSCSATWLRSQWLLTLCKTVRWPVSLQFSSRHCNVMCFLFDIGFFFETKIWLCNYVGMSTAFTSNGCSSGNAWVIRDNYALGFCLERLPRRSVKL